MDVCRSLADTFFTHRLCECRRTMLFSMFSELQHDYDDLAFMGSNVIFDGMTIRSHRHFQLVLLLVKYIDI